MISLHKCHQMLLALLSWTDSKSHQRSARCVTYCGRIHLKISAARRQRSTSLTTVLGVAHIFTGSYHCFWVSIMTLVILSNVVDMQMSSV